MSPELRQQYLKAMGVQLWQGRFQTEPNNEIESDIKENVEVLETLSAEEPLVTQAENEAPILTSDWLNLANEVNNCVACELHQTRTQAVVAEGSVSADVMVISTAPALNAESSSSLLEAESSQLFTNMLKAIETTREDIYFTSLVKCQLPQSRELRTTEVLCCEQYLTQQIDKVQPRLIVALGEFSAQQLLVSKKSLADLRGKVYQYHSIPLIVLSHPDDLLLNPSDKRNAWHDLLQIKQQLNA